MHTRRWLVLIWTCFVVRALFFACAIPIWEGFDEYAHYGRIEYVAMQGREPDRSTPLPADIASSLAHAPVHNGGMTIDQFWKMSPGERQSGFAAPASGIYEAQQPPLFYWLMTPVYRLMTGLSFESRFLWIRVFGVLLASLLIPLGFMIARSVCGSDPAALIATVLMAALPVLTFTATHVSNEALAIPLGALVVLLMLRDRPIPLALALGAALLTKAYFLLFLPPLVPMFFNRKMRRTGWVGMLGALVFAGWWYVHTWSTTGSLTGNVILSKSTAGVWSAIFKTPWGKAISYAWMTFVWTGNWSFLMVRSWMYRAAAIVCLLALAGVLYLIWKRDLRVALCTAAVASFACGIAYFGLVSFVADGFPGAIAWYACCLAAPIAVLMSMGLKTVAPSAIKRVSGPVLVIMFSALELFGTNLLLLPYYGGLISHLPNGGLPACKLGQLFSGSGLMMERLRLYKPPWLTAWALFALWGLYLSATAILMGASIRLAFRDATRPSPREEYKAFVKATGQT